MKTLKEAMKMREEFPDKVQIFRETRWYVCIDRISYELTTDRHSEDVSRWIDEKKALDKTGIR